MDEQTPIHELMSAFLDGELDGTEAETMFYMLAQSQELQAEMRKLITINAGFRKELITPPAHLYQNIVQRIAEQPALAVAPTASASHFTAVLTSRPFLMIASALCAVLLTLLAVSGSTETAHWQSSTDTPEAQKENGAKQQQAAALSTEQPSRVAALNNPKNSNTAHRQQRINAVSSWSNRADIAPHKRVAELNQTPVEHLPPNVATRQNDSAQQFVQQERPEQQEQIVLEQREQEHITEAPTALQTPDVQTTTDRLFALQIRGFTARSYPDVNIAPLATPVLNNMALGISYQFADGHDIGVEIGQENIEQRYSKTDKGIKTTIEQNYLAFWAGAMYRFSPDVGTSIRPFAQTFIGGTDIGPLARLSLGATYRTGLLSFAVGAEGTLHLSRYNNSWYTTSKLGTTYSISIHF